MAVPVKYKEIIGINIHHDDKKGATKLYANVIIKKENILLVYETKSKKVPMVDIIIKNGKNQSKRISGKI